MELSIAEQDHIKAIYHLQVGRGPVATGALAEELRTRPASVTDMLKRLRAKRIVVYERYKGFRLSAEGRRAALGIIRRHRLWEYFLSEKLQFSWEEVHEVAEELEHVANPKLIEKLDAFLGRPRFDPHGDPIPDGSGRICAEERVSLAKWPVGVWGEVSGVADRRPDMLELLGYHCIGIGTPVVVLRRFAFDGSLEVQSAGRPAFVIGGQLAEQVRIRKNDGT